LKAEGKPGRLKGKEYRKALAQLQADLCNLQEWVRSSGERVVIVFEGGVIKRIVEKVSPEEQEKRFVSRMTDPTKHWKLSPMDLEARRRWYDYSRACDAMFAATHTSWAPWYLVDTNDQSRARLNCMSHLLSQLPWTEVAWEVPALPDRQAPGDYQYPALEIERVPARW